MNLFAREDVCGLSPTSIKGGDQPLGQVSVPYINPTGTNLKLVRECTTSAFAYFLRLHIKVCEEYTRQSRLSHS